MPGNITSAGSVTDTYPFTTFSGFSVTHRIETAMNEYADGSSQRRYKAANHKRIWAVSHRLSATDVETIRTFYRSHIIAPFKFRDVSNGLQYNAVFAGPYNEERQLGNRYVVSLTVQEVA